MNKKILEAQDLPFGDKVYLKKDWLGWRTVEPLIDSEGHPITLAELFQQKPLLPSLMRNFWVLAFGGKRSLVFLIISLLIMGSFFIGIKQIMGDLKDIAENPCVYCQKIISTNSQFGETEDLYRNLTIEFKQKVKEVNQS